VYGEHEFHRCLTNRIGAARTPLTARICERVRGQMGILRSAGAVPTARGTPSDLAHMHDAVRKDRHQVVLRSFCSLLRHLYRGKWLVHAGEKGFNKHT
jgi:hypothetical protein